MASPLHNRKANEIQHRFNEEVADKLEEAGVVVDKVEPAAEGRMKVALEKIKDALAEGRQLIAHRQKLLKLDDHSEYGWSLVELYEDALADDSEDEKRIDKAERAAERKAQAKRRKEAALALSRYNSSKQVI